jgi:signal transduction histidine kinase
MRRQLAVMAAATTSMVVCAFLIPLAILVQTVVRDRALSAAELQAHSLAPVLATEHDPATLNSAITSISSAGPGRLTVFLADGTVLGDQRSADASVALALHGRAFTTSVPGGMPVLVPVLGPDQSTTVVEVRVPNSALGHGVATAWLILGALGVALVALAGFVADRMARSVVTPTRDLATAAHGLAQGRIETRVVPAGPPELVEVGGAFNLLAARMGELLAAERAAAADLSHRLRTPMTALRLDIEQLDEGEEGARLSEDLEDLERVVSSVIQELRRQTRDTAGSIADLAEVARERVAFWAALADEQDRPYRAEIELATALVRIPRDDLEAVLDAVIDNVFAHTPERTPFTISLRAAGAGRVRLTVEDEGPGIRATQAVRGDGGRRSTGLGLDIVRRAAAGTGGMLILGTGESGGARVEVEFGLVQG